MASDITTLLNAIAQNGSLFLQNPDSTGDSARHEIIAAATRLIHELESPGEALARISWEEPSRTASLRIAHDLDLFANLKPETPQTSSQLAENTKADPVLVGKLPQGLYAFSVLRHS